MGWGVTWPMLCEALGYVGCITSRDDGFMSTGGDMW